MHLCYAVACSSNTSYADIAYISARAAKIVHPDVTISILLDPATQARLTEVHCKLLDVADHQVVIPCDMESAEARSRFIKTAARQHVQGDFLLIDADALPVRPLDEIFQTQCDIAIAMDNNDPPEKQVIAPWVLELFEKLDWTYDKPNYYNGGVILFRDTPKSHAFAQAWHERWRQTHDMGIAKDQPSLNSSIAHIRPSIFVLPVRYNAMINHRVSSANNAAILHFWTSKNMPPGFMLTKLLASMKKTGEVDEAMLQEFVRTRYAWTDPNYISAQWHTGRYGAAAKAVCNKLLRTFTKA